MLKVPQITGIGELLCPVIETATDREIKVYLERQFAGQRAIVKLDRWVGTGNIKLDVEREQPRIPPEYGDYESLAMYYGLAFAPLEIAIMLSDIEFSVPNRLIEFNRVLRAFMSPGVLEIASAAGGEPLLTLTATYVQPPTFGEIP